MEITKKGEYIMCIYNHNKIINESQYKTENKAYRQYEYDDQWNLSEPIILIKPKYTIT